MDDAVVEDKVEKCGQLCYARVAQNQESEAANGTQLRCSKSTYSFSFPPKQAYVSIFIAFPESALIHC